MPIRFYCKQCTGKMKVPDGTGGKTAKCPRCGKLQSIPMETQPSRSKATAGAPAGAKPAASADSFDAADALASFTLDDSPLPSAERSARKVEALDIEQDAAIAEQAVERAMEANSKTAVNLDIVGSSGGSDTPVPEHPLSVESESPHTGERGETPVKKSKSPDEHDEASGGNALEETEEHQAAPAVPKAIPVALPRATSGVRPALPKTESVELEESGTGIVTEPELNTPISSEAKAPDEAEFVDIPVARPKVTGKAIRGTLTNKGEAAAPRIKAQVALQPNAKSGTARPAPPAAHEEEVSDDHIFENVSEVELDEPEAKDESREGEGLSTLTQVAHRSGLEHRASGSGTFAKSASEGGSVLEVMGWVLRLCAALGLGVGVKLVLISLDLGGNVPMNAAVAAAAGLIFVAVPLGVGEGLMALSAIKRKLK